MTNKKPPEASTIWGGRFSEGPSESMQAFNACLDDDKILAMEDIDGSLAHVAMLKTQNILTGLEADTISNGLETIRQEIIDGVFPWREALEDVHMNVETRLSELIGAVAGKLHTARSRNDQVATDFRLWTRRALTEIAGGITTIQQALFEQATGEAETVMPGFTHLQIAQPISYAHYCLAYIEMFERDRTRLLDARDRLNESPLGSAALAGTPHMIDRNHTAAALGFNRPCRNSLDGVSARDFALEAAAAASICATTISRYAEEVVIFSTPQFGYLNVGDAFSTGSSIMPQKRNPDAAELLRAKVGRIAGSFNALTLVTKGLPLAYSKDLQETKPLLFQALGELSHAVNITARMIKATAPNRARMAQDAGAGFSTATDIADSLATAGLPFREAHHIVGQLVALCEEKNINLHELSIDEANIVSMHITQEMLTSATPLASMRKKNSDGGAGPGPVKSQLDFWDRELMSR